MFFDAGRNTDHHLNHSLPLQQRHLLRRIRPHPHLLRLGVPYHGAVFVMLLHK